MTTPAVSTADANLWAAYGKKLKESFAQVSDLGADGRFYIAPLSAAGIAAGKNIDIPITNLGIFIAGDTLLDPTSPVFLPTRQSYSQRALLYSNSVFLDPNGNQGAAVRYQNAQEASEKAAKYSLQAGKEARAQWQEETTLGLTSQPFAQWIQTNAPAFTQAKNAQAAAAASAAAAAAAIGGPNAFPLSQISQALQTALGIVTTPGYTMECSTAPATQIAQKQAGTAGAPFNNPLYSISGQYGANVDNWINTFTQDEENPKTITFKASDASSSTWQDLGFDSSSVSVSGSYAIFFKATYTENNSTVTKYITAEQAGSDLEITLTATGLGTYQIQPGKWNPSNLWQMPLTKNADQALRSPAAYVNQVVIGYGVGLQVNLGSSVASQVHDYISKAQSSGGSVSIFGYDFGLGAGASSTSTSTTTFDQVKDASSGTTITIPPSDNAYPTLLAAIGVDLPTPPKK